jgi:hypothetical protein
MTNVIQPDSRPEKDQEQFLKRKTGLSETKYLVQLKPPLERLSKADPSNVQEVVASQIALMSIYHNEAIDQAHKSFKWASVIAITGVFFFLISIVVWFFQISGQNQGIAILSAIGGGIIEVISGLIFYLYKKTAEQMADFQNRLDITQRFMLANSICEGLQGEIKQNVRSELVRAIAGIQCFPVSANPPSQPQVEGVSIPSKLQKIPKEKIVDG